MSAIPTDRTTFSEYCLRKLGEPVIKVNVAVEQVEDRINEGLHRFYERHFNAVEPFNAIVIPSDQDITNQYITLPSDVVAITDVLRPSKTGGLFSMEYRAFIDSVYGLDGNLVSSLPNYYITQMNLSLIRELFFPQRNFAFNVVSSKLIIPGGLKDLANTDGGMIVVGYRKILGEVDQSSPTNSMPHNIWSERWLQNYCTALIKEQWASNLMKFSGIQMIGGVTLNGEQLKQEAKEELEALEEQLKLEYEQPVDMFFG